MSELKLTWSNDNKHEWSSCRVSIREDLGSGLLAYVCSPTDIVGTGSDFGSAREDLEEKLADYIAALTKFKDEVVGTKRAYEEAIYTDFEGKPLCKNIK